MTATPATMSRATRRVADAGAALLRVRGLVRAPVWLYRARLGFLFGTRLLMLEHIGRTSGARRYVVLEIVARPSPGTYIVASGFGTKAQWFRNVVADPQVRVYLAGHRPRPAAARVLDHDHSSAALAAYAAAHPRAWQTLRPVFEATLGAQIDDRATSLPLVALRVNDMDNDHQDSVDSEHEPDGEPRTASPEGSPTHAYAKSASARKTNLRRRGLHLRRSAE